MRYPILLGRKLLNKKFLVDVSKTRIHISGLGARRVLLLASNPKNIGTFAANVAAQLQVPPEITVCGYDQLSFWIQPGKVRVREAVTGRDLADYNLVYFKSHRRFYPLAVAAAQYLAFKHVPFFDSELGYAVSYDKLSEALRLAVHDVPVPKAFAAMSARLRDSFTKVSEAFGTQQLICKEINADRGRDNYFITSAAQLREILAAARATDVFMLQEFIENEGYARADVFGCDVPLVVRRTPVVPADSRKRHLNNPAGSANATLLQPNEVPSAVYDLAIRASKLMRRQIAGVDFIQDKHTKEWLVLEVNNAPQLVGGPYLLEKQAALAKFIDIELNR